MSPAARFQQELFEERIADLHVRAFCFRPFAEFFAGHGGAMNAVTSSLCADVHHRITFAGGARVEDLIFPHQTHGKCIYQRIARVARLKFNFSAKIRHTKAVAVGSDAADHSFHDRVVLVEFALRSGFRGGDGAEAQ